MNVAYYLLAFDRATDTLYNEMGIGELLAMHINMASRRSEAFPPGVQERLARMKSAHSALPLAPQVGRTLGIRVK